jgi:hypothetical protein
MSSGFRVSAREMIDVFCALVCGTKNTAKQSALSTAVHQCTPSVRFSRAHAAPSASSMGNDPPVVLPQYPQRLLNGYSDSPVVLSDNTNPVHVVNGSPLHVPSLLVSQGLHVLGHVHQNLFSLAVGHTGRAQRSDLRARCDEASKRGASRVAIAENPRVDGRVEVAVEGTSSVLHVRKPCLDPRPRRGLGWPCQSVVECAHLDGLVVRRARHHVVVCVAKAAAVYACTQGRNDVWNHRVGQVGARCGPFK